MAPSVAASGVSVLPCLGGGNRRFRPPGIVRLLVSIIWSRRSGLRGWSKWRGACFYNDFFIVLMFLGGLFCCFVVLYFRVQIWSNDGSKDELGSWRKALDLPVSMDAGGRGGGSSCRLRGCYDGGFPRDLIVVCVCVFCRMGSLVDVAGS